MVRLIESKTELQFYLREDFKVNLKIDHYSCSYYYKQLLLKDDGAMAFRFLKALRKLEYVINCKKGKSPFGQIIFYLRFLYFKHLSFKYGLNILPNTVGYGLYLPHIVGGGIVLVCKSMGNYCVVNTGTIIGIKNSMDEVPIIGNNCEINAGSKIFGRIMIGDNVKIGPNTVLFRDVPSNCSVSGVPAKLIKRDGVKVSESL